MDVDGELISGRYRVESPLGKGGMGSVLRVLDESNGGHFALKRLTRADSARHLALFEREYHTLASLQHPDVVRVEHYGSDEHGPYYTMELLEGSDASTLAPLPWPEVCRILRDVASALSLLHARRLVHRDINPRNLWLTEDGAVKLIDFGALAPFGHVDHVVGTPPTVPPEALYSQLIDQRSDLYALGAVGYWLLSGVHAYPARSLSQLKSLWAEPVRPPSAWVENLSRNDLPIPPRVLDELILALLGHDPMARPSSATEVVDRLNTIASLPPKESAPAVEAHLRSTAFVGRAQPLRRLTRSLESARSGHGSAILLDSAPGGGRSRLLAEFGLRAGLRGATVLQVSASMHTGPAALANACAQRLLEVLPERARDAARPHASTLGHLSPALREALGMSEADLARMPQTPGEARMRVQAALFEWFVDTCRAHPLVLLVDDVPAADETSLAWLAQLAHACPDNALLFVGTQAADVADERPAFKALRRDAQAIHLSPLREPELYELLSSVFGDAPHLGRLCGLLHQRSGGNPGHAMQLAEHLVRTEVVTYADASWILPQDLDGSQLPDTPLAALASRLSGLSEDACWTARALSLATGTVPLEQCVVLSGLQSAPVYAALDELSRAGILVGASGGYQFAHESLRGRLQEELAPDARAAVHGRIAETMLATPQASALTRLEAAVHGMRGENRRDAPLGRFGTLATRASLDIVFNNQENLGAATPHLEAALGIFDSAKRPAHERIPLVTALALAGYYADRRLLSSYADPALELLQGVLYLPLARKLRAVLGARLALYIALAVAFASFLARRNNPRVPQFRDTVLLLLNASAALTGAVALCLDPERAMRYARIIEPLCALGDNHAASITYRLATNAANTISDRLADVHACWHSLRKRLEDPAPIGGLNDEVRTYFRAGALYGMGIIGCYRDGPEALEIATELASFKMKIYEMSADQLRTVYYAHQGDLARSEHYRQRVEMHAIARGTAWQVEAWLPGPMMALYLRTHDAASMKRQVQQLERLVKQLPWLDTYLTRSLGAYYLLSGRHEEALPYLRQGLEEPRQQLIGWARGYGAMARALNELGEHEQAKQVCEQALAHMTERDLDFCATNLGVAVEHARAESGLGNVQAAAKQIDVLLARYAPLEGPLTLGSLHEVRTQIAEQAGDTTAADFHLAEMQSWYGRTDVPSLLRRRAAAAKQADGPDEDDRLDRAEQQTTDSLIHRLTHGGEGDCRKLGRWMLEQLAQVAGFGECYLFGLSDDEPVQLASLEGKVSPGAVRDWLVERVDAAIETGDETALITGDAYVDEDRITIDGTTYRFYPLYVARSSGPALIAALVSDDSKLVRETVSAEVLGTMAKRLSSALNTTATLSTEADATLSAGHTGRS